METKHVALFIDLDGVLCDFDAGVRSIFNASPDEIHPSRMWSRLATTPGFYEKLSWTIDGRELWKGCLSHNPVILTGLPAGKWAEPQKRLWCARELGENVEVITCRSKEKAMAAKAHSPEAVRILVDDRESLRESWELEGGIFILHTSAVRSLAQLDDVLGKIERS